MKPVLGIALAAIIALGALPSQARTAPIQRSESIGMPNPQHMPGDERIPADYARQVAEASFYNAANAPDELSRQILSHELMFLDQIPDGPAISTHSFHRIYLNYAQIVEQNFAKRTAWSARKLVDSLSDHEIHQLFSYYRAHVKMPPGGSTRLMQVIALRLDATRLARVQDIETAVAMEPPGGWPNWNDMTPGQIYNELRTGVQGGISAASALLETCTIIGKVYYAYQFGYSIGTQAGYLLEEYDPQLYTDIGGTVEQAVESLYEAGSYWREMGEYQQGIADVFGWDYSYGVPWRESGVIEQGGGDYGAGDDWSLDYETDYGGFGGACRPYACKTDER
jgi:hypothetical protein